jgi:hypothetical protein
LITTAGNGQEDQVGKPPIEHQCLFGKENFGFPLVTSRVFEHRLSLAATLIHAFERALRRFVGPDIAVAIFRAQSMNRSARGWGVRSLTVMMPTTVRSGANFTGNALSPTRLALKSATELGSSPTNRPVAIRVAVSWPDKLTMLARGGAMPAARKTSRISRPGKLL